MQAEMTGGTVATIVAMIICAVIFFIAVAGILLIAEDAAERIGSFIVLVVVTALVAVGFWWGMFPWKFEYHHWVPVSGVLETVDSRLVSTGDNTMEDKFVVKFQGNDQQYAVLDTRAAGLKPGDRLTITCVRQYQWVGTHGYDCNFVDMVRAVK